jgi:hypothetical protein
MFQAKVVEKIKTQTLSLIGFFFFRKSFLLRDVEKYGTAGEATDNNIRRRYDVICMLDI